MHTRGAFLLFSLLLTSTRSFAAPATPDTLSSRWSDAMQDLHIPGAVVLVVNRDGIARQDLLGLRDVERKLPIDPDTRLYIASCTKPFVACATCVLASEGRLDLDAPVKRYLPRFDLADHGYADSVTVRDLLAHRPGLVSRAITFGDAYTGQMTDERYYRLLAGVRPLRSFDYSNLHYTLLGRVIESVTGKSWQDVLAEKIFKPAGMTRTTCRASTALSDGDVAFGYAFENGTFVRATPAKTNATMHAAGGIYTTPGDLARWLRLQLGDGVISGHRVLPEGAIIAMRQLLAPDAAEPHPVIKSEKRISWGAGWDIRTIDADTLYCHNGNFAGAGAFMGIIPSQDVGVAVVGNGPQSVYFAEVVGEEALQNALHRSGADYLTMLRKMGAEPGAGPPSAHGALSAAPRLYAGEYANADWGVMRVRESHGVLDAAIGALPLPIQLTGTDRFTSAGYKGRFELDAKGKVRAVWLDAAAPDSVRFERR